MCALVAAKAKNAAGAAMAGRIGSALIGRLVDVIGICWLRLRLKRMRLDVIVLKKIMRRFDH